MVRTLAIKELREIGWIAALAFAAYLVVVGAITSTAVENGLESTPGLQWLMWKVLQLDYYRTLPFVYGDFAGAFFLISLVVLVALGFRQSFGESRAGTFPFLLHRPVDRRIVFLTKLGVGIGLFWFVAALPILLLAWWAATPGTHPSPFEWSMTYPVWRTWAALPVVYLGAFLSGIRHASWWGTRLVPLAATVVITMSFASWWWIMLPLAAASAVLLVTSILWIAHTRDFS